MKVLVVGDTHGNLTPLKIAKNNICKVDKVIFTGDYIDSFDNDWSTQRLVLEKIFEFKKQNQDKVELLIGNHDLSYYSKQLCSGHQFEYENEIYEFIKEHFLEFRPFVRIDNWLFSHAGISASWMEDCDFSSLQQAEEAFYQQEFFAYNHRTMDSYGRNSREGCLWIRPRSLTASPFCNYNQCVGHTELYPDQNKIFIGENKYVFIDSIERDTWAIIDTETNDISVFIDDTKVEELNNGIYSDFLKL